MLQNVFVLFLLVSSFGFSQNETTVLFIGNSFTFYNKMPFIFKDIAKSQGHNVIVDTVIKGGKELNFHSSREYTYKTIKSRKWDFVVIQAASNEFAQPDKIIEKSTLPYAQQLVDSIRANDPCTNIIFYMTWGYKNGNPGWKPVSCYDSMQIRIENQYLKIADKFSGSLSPVGAVWREVRTNFPEIELYNPDNKHPSLEGSYLSAATFFTSIFGESPENCNVTVEIDPKTKINIEKEVSKLVLTNSIKWKCAANKHKLDPGFDLKLMDNQLELTNHSKLAHSTEWDFGDGNGSKDHNPKHTYTKKGEFTITQKIMNKCKMDSIQKTIIVK